MRGPLIPAVLFLTLGFAFPAGAQNRAPIATSDNFQVNEDAVLNVVAPGVLANDRGPHKNNLSAWVVTQPTKGTLTLRADGSFQYAPRPNLNGADAFAYVASNGRTVSNVATVGILIGPVNDPPLAMTDSLSTKEDAPLVRSASNGVLANDTDIDGDVLRAVLLTSPSHGTLALGADGSIDYRPFRNFNGTDFFEYFAGDGLSRSGRTGVTITVLPVNDPPSAQDLSTTCRANKNQAVTLSAIDVDGDPLTFQVELLPQHGTLTGNEADRVYTPSRDFLGFDTFTFTASDGQARSAERVVALNVLPEVRMGNVSIAEGTNLLPELFNFTPVPVPITISVPSPLPIAIRTGFLDRPDCLACFGADFGDDWSFNLDLALSPNGVQDFVVIGASTSAAFPELVWLTKDAHLENNEVFTLRLVEVQGALIDPAFATGSVTILNDDILPVSEGQPGQSASLIGSEQAPLDLPKELAIQAVPSLVSQGATVISYAVPQELTGAPVAVAVFDVAGRSVRTLISETKAAGRYSVAWDSRDQAGSPVSNGVFFVRMNAGGRQLRQRIVVMR